jgi:hypothetical protein
MICSTIAPIIRFLCLQNPFYEMEMPIRCDLFHKHLDRLIVRMNSASQTKRRAA